MTNRDEAAKLAANERREGWATIMATPASRRVMWELFEQMGIYQSAPSIKPTALAFNEGRRSLALQVMNEMLAICPEQYDRMTIENRARMRLELKLTEEGQENDE